MRKVLIAVFLVIVMAMPAGATTTITNAGKINGTVLFNCGSVYYMKDIEVVHKINKCDVSRLIHSTRLSQIQFSHNSQNGRLSLFQFSMIAFQ